MAWLAAVQSRYILYIPAVTTASHRSACGSARFEFTRSPRLGNKVQGSGIACCRDLDPSDTQLLLLLSNSWPTVILRWTVPTTWTSCSTDICLIHNTRDALHIGGESQWFGSRHKLACYDATIAKLQPSKRLKVRPICSHQATYRRASSSPLPVSSSCVCCACCISVAWHPHPFSSLSIASLPHSGNFLERSRLSMELTI